MTHIPAREKIILIGDIYLLFRDAAKGDYASCRIQKGLLLACGQEDLSEEGMGFGVPILKFGHEAIFPGSARIGTRRDGDKTIVDVGYDLNLVEIMAVKGKKINNRYFYTVKEYLSWLHREYPHFRKILTRASNTLRRFLDIETRFEEVATFGRVDVRYIINADNIRIRVDTSRVKKYGCTEIMLMNEQGANYFDIYRDSNGTALSGNAIGTWGETFAGEASFVDPYHNLEFTLQKVAGSRMFLGRELVHGRLAWAGLAYLIPSCTDNFEYDIRIKG